LRTKSIAFLSLFVLVSGCGKKEPPITNLILGNFHVSSITCNGGDPGSTIKDLYTSPNALRLAFSDGLVRQTQEEPGCTILQESSITYEEPGKTTAKKMVEVRGGAYSCTPAACDAICGTAVPAKTIEYDFVQDSTVLNLVAYGDGDPLCADVFYTLPKD
jgi:hypothetical protein